MAVVEWRQEASRHERQVQARCDETGAKKSSTANSHLSALQPSLFCLPRVIVDRP